MKPIDVNTLDVTVKFTLLMAVCIRNEIEDFHCKHLSDEQMKELNPIIRQAIYNMLRCQDLAFHGKTNKEKKLAQEVIAYQISTIPDYWEHPSEEVFQEMFLEGSRTKP